MVLVTEKIQEKYMHRKTTNEHKIKHSFLNQFVVLCEMVVLSAAICTKNGKGFIQTELKIIYLKSFIYKQLSLLVSLLKCHGSELRYAG